MSVVSRGVYKVTFRDTQGKTAIEGSLMNTQGASETEASVDTMLGAEVTVIYM